MKTDYIAFEIEKLFENEFGKSKKNNFSNNLIFSKTNLTFNYRGEIMSADAFNSKSNVNPFKDEMKNNSQIIF